MYLKIIAVISIFVLHLYWRISEKGLRNILDFNFTFKSLFDKSIYSCAQFILVLQLFGLTIFPIYLYNLPVQVFAISLMLIGLIICIISRFTLGKSWTNAKDYKSITDPKLVTSGPYKFIRHPIYLGLNLMLLGGEIITGSYLIILIPFIYIWSYKQAKKEEVHFQIDFGPQYEKYKSKTHMFIPFLI